MRKSTTAFTDRREIAINAPPEAVFRALCRLGGHHGWYGADWLWRLRGFGDRLLGGPAFDPDAEIPSESPSARPLTSGVS